MLFLFIWQDVQHRDMDIAQRAGQRPVPHAVAGTADTVVTAVITGRTRTRPIPRQEAVQSAGAAVAETAEA
jgi:hypothetical protein